MRGLIPATICFIFVAFIFIIDTRLVRFSTSDQPYGCSVAQLSSLPPEIDLVLLGSSRVKRGIDASFLAKSSKGALESVYNLGRDGKSIARNYAILRDLINLGVHPKAAFVEINLEQLGALNEVDAPGSPLEAPDPFSSTVEYGDIFAAGEYLYQAGENPIPYVFNSIKAKIRTTAGGIIKGRIFSSAWALYSKSQYPCWKTEFDEDSVDKAKDRQTHLSTVKSHYKNLAQAQDDRFSYVSTYPNLIELYYVDQIRKLASRNNFKLYFGRFQAYGDPPYTDAAVNRIRVLIPEFIYPSKEFVRSNSLGYADAVHMGLSSRRAYSAWLAGVVGAHKN